MTAVAGSTVEQSITAARPYPPSWVDRLTDWARHLPGPAWPYYLAIGLLLGLVRTVAGWSDGSYPVGTVFHIHVQDGLTCIYFLFVLHYLDDSANTALADFRPALATDAADYEGLRYQLTTMPARPVLVVSIVGIAIGLLYNPFLDPAPELQRLKYFALLLPLAIWIITRVLERLGI